MKTNVGVDLAMQGPGKSVYMVLTHFFRFQGFNTKKVKYPGFSGVGGISGVSQLGFV